VKKSGLKRILFLCLFMPFSLLTAQVAASEPSISTYTSYPIFQLSTVAPNIMIILDNSASMNLQAYNGPYDHNTKYYGYFEPYEKYGYGSNIFVRDENGEWDGNFLNWLTMRRIDVARKVLMGGLATSRQGTGNQTNIGEAPSETGYDFTKAYVDTDGVTPFDDTAEKYYLVDGGNFYVDGNTYVIRVDKDMNKYPDEAYNFVDGNLAGILQKIGDKARWGNMFFNYGTGKGESGGYIASTIGTNMPSLITDLQNTACDTWTPLAETYYVATQYFKQEDVQDGLHYPNNVVPNENLGDDPYYDGTQFIHCAKSFVLLLTDGMSTMDMMIPDALKDYDGDGNDPGSFPDHGSDYLDDIALYARINDLRPDLDGDQNLILYTIYAFGDDPNAERLLRDAARNGGYVEKNGTTGPDLTEEWDANGDGDPDTYYRADNGYQLEAKILQAVNDILERAASGTAVSVLATSGEGEGNLVQAYYRPLITKNLKEYRWFGYLQSLWVDPYGYLREDTDQDMALDVTVDNVLVYFMDEGSGDVKVKKFSVSASNPYPDIESDDNYVIMGLDEIYPLWEAGSLLSERDANDRKIFTYIDKDNDGLVDDSTGDPFDTSGEVIRFHTDAMSSIKPYLGVRDDTAWSYLGSNHDERSINLIDYIRGVDIAGSRSRKPDYNVWKLGDIVHSTPVSVSKPPDNYHVIYSDESYQAYYEAFKDRETVIYVGANDGMLHAFTSWRYDQSNKEYQKPSGAPSGERIGDELWAYIPQSLLPHLKWLPSPDYTHVYYVDQKPKIFDAKILPDDTHYADSDAEDNWGTFLLLGLNFGGKHIRVTDDFNGDGDITDAADDRHFYPTYALIDITEPRSPKLLWERTYTDLELTTSFPAVVKVKEKWFAVFGSGPTDFDGTSSKEGHIFVVDLKTGNPYKSGTNDWLFETGEANAFLSSPVSIDKDLNYSVDAVYFGETYMEGSWKGKVYRVTIPLADSYGVYDASDIGNYSDNPLDTTNPWRLSPLFDATRPITASLAISRDELGNVWVFGGTGRYMNNDDKSDADTQYLFGIKDPFFNKDHSPSGLYGDDYYHNYDASLELQISDLLNADDYTVTTNGEIYLNGTSIGNWYHLLDTARAKDGWIKSLTIAKERILKKPSLLGGILFAASFVPSSDICGYGGESYLYGVYYETGTAYYEPSFSDGLTTVTIEGEEKQEVLDLTALGSGLASSLGIHVGSQKDATGFVQQSTGTILTDVLSPAFLIRSGIRSWREK